MKQTISKDLKEQILARVREGKETVTDIARQHGVNPNTVYNWISRNYKMRTFLKTIGYKVNWLY